MKSLPFPSRNTQGLLLGLMLCFVTGVQANFKDILADTLLPGITYKIDIKTSADYPVLPVGIHTDTVFLKGQGQTYSMFFQDVSDAFSFYTLSIPYQAKAGFYDIYNRAGKLIESQVTFIANVNLITPLITKSSKLRGLRNMEYTVTFSGIGLPFGPLPLTGNFIPDVAIANLKKGSLSIPLALISGTNPYSQAFTFPIPADADTGSYALTVERMNGVRTIMLNAIQVWIPPKPVIDSVRPDTLYVDEEGAIGLRGTNMAFDVAVEKYTSGGITYLLNATLDREMVQEVFLRKDGYTLKAKNYGFYNVNKFPYNYIPASFLPTQAFPLGLYDVGLVLNGRTDTSFLRQGLRLIGTGTPALKLMGPSTMGRYGVEANIHGSHLHGDLRRATFWLKHGSTVAKGNFIRGTEFNVWVNYSVPPGSDTGYYDVIAELDGNSLVIPAGMHVMLPEIGWLRPTGAQAGALTDLEFAVENVDYGWYLSTSPDSSGLTKPKPNLKSARYCQGSNCFNGTLSGFGQYGVQAAIAPKSTQLPGLYDLEAVQLSDGVVLRKPKALLLSPPGLYPLVFYDEVHLSAYFSLTIDSTFTLTLPNYLKCGQYEYRLADPVAKGLVFLDGKLSWTPTMSDTGVSYITLTPTVSGCSEGLFLALLVQGKSITGLMPKIAEKSQRSRAAFWSHRNGQLEIHLAEPASLEIWSVQGRILGAYSNLTVGRHTLFIPASANNHGLLLCRVRQESGVSWLQTLNP